MPRPHPRPPGWGQNPEPYKDPDKSVCGLCGKPKTSLWVAPAWFRVCHWCDMLHRWPELAQ